MMITRRDAVASFALFAELVASGQLAAAQTQTAPASPPAVPRPPVFKQDLPNVTMDGWEVTVSYVDYAPGRVGAAHHHAGFVLVYVLQGAVIAKISGTGRGKDVHDRADVLRTARRDARGLEKCEPDRARENPRDDLREERLDADHAGVRRSRSRRRVKRKRDKLRPSASPSTETRRCSSPSRPAASSSIAGASTSPIAVCRRTRITTKGRGRWAAT